MAPNLASSLAKLSPFFKKKQVLLHYRLVVLGSGAVGKTSIVRRLLTENDFEERHIPTVEQLYQMEYKMRNSEITLLLDLLDTSGSYPFPAMQDLAIRNADAFLLVYSVDDQASYEEIVRLKEKITELRKQNIPPIVVVANKADLDERALDTNLIDSIITMDWEYGHVEVSAKNNENLGRIFTQLLRQKLLVEKLQQQQLTSSSSGQLDSEGSETESDTPPPSRPSISSSEIFFPEDFRSSQNSLDIESRKSSITDTELEFRLRNGFKNANCIIQ